MAQTVQGQIGGMGPLQAAAALTVVATYTAAVAHQTEPPRPQGPPNSPAPVAESMVMAEALAAGSRVAREEVEGGGVGCMPP